MWGDKKPEAAGKKPVPQQPPPSQQVQQVRPTVPSANAPAFPGEAKTMAPIDSTYPSTSSGNTARLGSSLQAAVEVFVPERVVEVLRGVDLAELCITSAGTVRPGPVPEDAFTLPDLPDIGVRVSPAPGER